jgi:hypothetical protein
MSGSSHLRPECAQGLQRIFRTVLQQFFTDRQCGLEWKHFLFDDLRDEFHVTHDLHLVLRLQQESGEAIQKMHISISAIVLCFFQRIIKPLVML